MWVKRPLTHNTPASAIIRIHFATDRGIGRIHVRENTERYGRRAESKFSANFLVLVTEFYEARK